MNNFEGRDSVLVKNLLQNGDSFQSISTNGGEPDPLDLRVFRLPKNVAFVVMEAVFKLQINVLQIVIENLHNLVTFF